MPAESERSPTLLFADPDAEIVRVAEETLRECGWETEVATDWESCREALERGPRVAVIATALARESLDDLSGEIAATRPPGTSVVLALEAGDGAALGALLAAGIEDFVHRDPIPALLCHRLRRFLPRAEPFEPLGAGCWLDREAFCEELAEHAATARSADDRVVVFVVQIEDSQRGEDWSQLTPDADQALTDEVGRRMWSAFEGEEESQGLHDLQNTARFHRLGSNAFAMMISGLERLQDAARLGGRLQGALLQPISVAGELRGVQVGLGVSSYPEDGVDPARLIDQAADAAGRARQEGSSLVLFHTEAMGRWAFERLTLERSLRNAIDGGELRVYYQPRVDAVTRQIMGLEALVRWQHPDLGLVSPAQFIPLAEETGLIVPIGEWVLREACRQNREWRDRGLAKVRVSVNLSPVQFQRPDLFDTVMRALNDSGLGEDGLELEVTESMLMNDPQRTAETLQQLRGAGIHISIDDFGTGYSSLSYLKRFPIDALKIDRSFITDVTSNPDDAAITTAIILMGHSLRLTVVAEGVETENQLEFLRVLQCNEIQGYLFSPPEPAERAEEFLRTGHATAA